MTKDEYKEDDKRRPHIQNKIQHTVEPIMHWRDIFYCQKSALAVRVVFLVLFIDLISGNFYVIRCTSIISCCQLLQVSLIVPDFTISLCGSSFLSFSRFLCVYSFLIASPRQERMPRNRQRKQIRENDAQNERLPWTAVHRNCKIWDYQTRQTAIVRKHFSRNSLFLQTFGHIRNRTVV